MYFNNPIKAAAYIVLLLACGYAFWRGGKPERWAGALILLDWFVTPWVQNHDALSHAQTGVLVLDGVLTFALLTIAAKSNRYWPLWAAAFQLLEVLMHIAMLVDHHVKPRAYYIGMEIWSYLMLIALAGGTWLEVARKTGGEPKSAGAGQA